MTLAPLLLNQHGIFGHRSARQAPQGRAGDASEKRSAAGAGMSHGGDL
jgi:hypothetical protein